MAFPYSETQTVFEAGTAVATTVELEGSYSRGTGSLQLSFTYAGHTGLVDIQGRLHPDEDWRNLPYIVVGSGAGAAVTSQISNTTVTAQADYLVNYPMPYMRVVMTRSAGTVEAYARFYSHPLNLQMAGLSSTALTNLATVAGEADRRAVPYMANGGDGAGAALVATAQAVKASAGIFLGAYVYNPNAVAIYFHVYDHAAPTVGTTNPRASFTIPAGAAANVHVPAPVAYGTAISIAATTTAGGNTNPSTGLDVTVFYE